jgi:hypothetical protein
MGTNPDEIERQIREQRALIDQRMQGLETRIRQDVDTARTETANRTSGSVDSVKEIFQPSGPMRDHPLSMMAGALGLGVVLGMVSEGLTSGNGNSSHENGRSYSRSENGSSNGSSGLASMVSSLVGPAAVTAQNELQDLIKEGFATLKGHDNGKSSNMLRENRDVGVE